MFNADFYPTPEAVIAQMTAGLDLAGKTVLEPSAGSGNIIDFCKKAGAKVIACEVHPQLALIASRKADRFLKDDFLKVTSEEISHVDYIIMNPPFSRDEAHILHAFEVAPEGCHIISLCNWNTIKNSHFKSRELLIEKIKFFGSVVNLGSCFSDGERATEVEIGLVNLFKPRTGENEFDGYFDMTDDEQQQENGIMAYNDIRNIVDRYVGAVKMFDSVKAVSDQINAVIAPINGGSRISFGAKQYDNNSRSNVDISRDTFKKELCKSAWKSIFDKMDMHKYVTTSIMNDINRFVEQQSSVPFTLKNIYKMIEMVIGTHGSRMDRVLVEAFDLICSYSADNSTAGETWKTNSNYKVNRRFIIPSICDYDTRWPSAALKVHYQRADKLEDIVKALCYMTGQKFENHINLRNYFDYPYHIQRPDSTLVGGYNNLHNDIKQAEKAAEKLSENGERYKVHTVGRTWGDWHEWGFFNVRGYKKGTMHFEFRDEKVWEDFNRRVAKIKGWALPSNTDSKRKGTERTRKTGVEVY